MSNLRNRNLSSRGPHLVFRKLRAISSPRPLRRFLRLWETKGVFDRPEQEDSLFFLQSEQLIKLVGTRRSFDSRGVLFPVSKMSPATAGEKKKKKLKMEDRFREIEVLIISAQDLKNVKHLTKMRTYAAVYVDSDHVSKTRVDEEGGVNPTWNEKLTVRFKEREGEEEEDVMRALNVDIYAEGHVREKAVGTARVLLCDVLKGGDAAEPADNPIQCLTLQVRRPNSGRPQGLLNLWVPPTGKFLIRRESLSFSVREDCHAEKGDGGAAAAAEAAEDGQHKARVAAPA
ncbi:hypothetical protein ACLOJK_008446 [Asimina triloba]